VISAAIIAIAVLVLGLAAGIAVVRLGSMLAPGSPRQIRRAYRRQRADLARMRVR
jgi:hypothetical protein